MRIVVASLAFALFHTSAAAQVVTHPFEFDMGGTYILSGEMPSGFVPFAKHSLTGEGQIVTDYDNAEVRVVLNTMRVEPQLIEPAGITLSYTELVSSTLETRTVIMPGEGPFDPPIEKEVEVLVEVFHDASFRLAQLPPEGATLSFALRSGGINPPFFVHPNEEVTAKRVIIGRYWVGFFERTLEDGVLVRTASIDPWDPAATATWHLLEFDCDFAPIGCSFVGFDNQGVSAAGNPGPISRFLGSTEFFRAELCGDANKDDAITGIDIGGTALCANNAAGATSCDPEIADADGDGATTALDIGGIVAVVNGQLTPGALDCTGGL